MKGMKNMNDYIPKQFCEERNKTVNEKIAKLEHDVSSLKRIYDKIEQLTLSIERNVTETKYMREKINDMDGRVKILEDHPKKRYEQVVSLLISLIIGAIVGIALAKIGLQ